MNNDRHVSLSIITIVLNDSRGLSRTIFSVKNQNLAEIEHLIVDGGSTDGSAEIAERFSHSPIDSKPDGGIYPAMQRGAQKASGEYLIFCNAGDLLVGSDFLDAALKKLRDSDTLWGFGPLIEQTDRGTFSWVSADKNANSESIVSRSSFVPFPTFIIQREYFFSLGGFTSNYRIAGDFELICKAALNSKHAVFDDPIAQFSAGGVSYQKANVAWQEEISIRTRLLSLSKPQVWLQWTAYFFRVLKWNLGKFLDSIGKLLPRKFSSWRDLRATEVPEEYKSFLTQ